MAIKPDLIKWVTDDSASKISDPGSTKKLAGWLYREKPAFQFFNWLFNRIHKWFLGLQGNYFDIVVGSSSQVTALEATHEVDDLDDALVLAGSKVLFLDGTHTLTADLDLSNADVVLYAESPLAIIDVDTFQILLSGARTLAKLRTTGTGANDIQLSGASSHLEGLDIDITHVQVTNGASARTTGTTGGIKPGIIIPDEGAPVVSAATTDIWTPDGNSRHVTGSTGPITSFGTAPRAGAVMWITFDGTPTLTDGANLALPGGKDIVIAAGDVARVYADTTTQFDVQIFRKDGNTAARFRGALVYLDSTQSIATATPENIDWDQEIYDTDDIHDNVTNNSRLTVPSGVSFVKVSAQIIWALDTAGDRTVEILRNGASDHFSARIEWSAGPNSTFDTQNPTSAIIPVSGGDYFEVEVVQTSGGALDINGSAIDSKVWFAMEIIH